jgi:O-antigen/teichoic acid export membrane protein
MPESAQDLVPAELKSPLSHTLREGSDSFRSRYLRLTTGAAAGLVARLLSAGGNLVIIPLVLHSLGQEQFGIWAVIMSLNAVTGFADLGLGNGLVNRLATVRHNESNPKITVGSGLYSLAGAGAMVLALTVVCYTWLPWASLLHISPALADPSRRAFLAWGCCTALSIPLSCAQKIQLAWQENERIGAWQAFSAILALSAAAAVTRLSPSLPNFVLAAAGSQCLMLLTSNVVEFYFRRPWLRPGLFDFRPEVSAVIAKSGGKLALLQAFSYLGFFSDSLLIAHNQGTVAAAKYSVMTRVYSLVFLGQYFTAPLWSAFANAYGRGEWLWMRTIFRRSVYGALILGLCTSVLFLGTKSAVRIWLGDSMQPDLLLVTGFAVWNLVNNIYLPITALMSIDVFLWSQIRYYGAASVVAFALKLFAVRHGMNWVIWCADLAFGAVLVPALYFIRNHCFNGKHE